MPNRHHIINELNELQSTLGSLQPGNHYQAPAGYFDNLPQQILLRIKTTDAIEVAEELAQLSPLLAAVSKKMPNAVPPAYFEELDPAIAYTIEQTSEEELDSISPLLSGLKKQTTFTVPDGYFDQLTAITGKEEQPAETKVIAIKSRRKWLQYAAAAVTISFVAISSFFLLNKKDNNSTANIDKPAVWIEKNMNKVSTEEINAFIQLADEEQPNVAQTSYSDEIKNLMKNVSDKEIQEFLSDADLAETDSNNDILN